MDNRWKIVRSLTRFFPENYRKTTQKLPQNASEIPAIFLKNFLGLSSSMSSNRQKNPSKYRPFCRPFSPKSFGNLCENFRKIIRKTWRKFVHFSGSKSAIAEEKSFEKLVVARPKEFFRPMKNKFSNRTLCFQS